MSNDLSVSAAIRLLTSMVVENGSDIGIAGGIANGLCVKDLSSAWIADENDLFMFFDKIEGEQIGDAVLLLHPGFMVVEVELADGQLSDKGRLPPALLDFKLGLLDQDLFPAMVPGRLPKDLGQMVCHGLHAQLDQFFPQFCLISHGGASLRCAASPMRCRRCHDRSC